MCILHIKIPKAGRNNQGIKPDRRGDSRVTRSYTYIKFVGSHSGGRKAGTHANIVALWLRQQRQKKPHTPPYSPVQLAFCNILRVVYVVPPPYVLLFRAAACCIISRVRRSTMSGKVVIEADIVAMVEQQMILLLGSGASKSPPEMRFNTCLLDVQR